MAVPSAAFDFVQVPFSVNGAWVAKWNGDGTYGTPAGVFANQAQIDVKQVSDSAKGNSAIVATAALVESVDLTLDVVSIQFPVMSIFYANLNAASSAMFTDLGMGRLYAQYFGMIIESLSDSGTALRYLIPKLKVMSGITWKLGYGKLLVPQFKATGIWDVGLTNWIVDPREYPSSATAINFPPSW